MRTKGSSLTARVARITILAAGLGAALTAAISTIIAQRLLIAGMDTRLQGAALAMAQIMSHGNEAQIMREIGEDARELSHSGLRLAVFEGRRSIGGDASVPWAEGAGCRTNATGAEQLRLCVVPVGNRTVVVAGLPGEIAERVGLFAQAALIAVALTLIAAMLIGRRLAARVVGPLTRLRQAVATVPDHAPGSVALGSDEGWAEVDALRGVLTELLARLDRALTQAKNFAADAAHELRTPLATMRAELELLAEEPGDREAMKESIARVHRTLLSVSSLVERLLILALPADTEMAEGQAVSMADIVREAHGELPAEARGRVTIQLADEGIVRGDAALFRAMVDNAIDNALKFGAAHPVVVKVAAQNGQITTSFQDQGPGIPPDERKRVFQPFYRARAARAGGVRGHGIGLALIAHVAAKHGGGAVFRDVTSGALLQINLPAWRAIGSG